MSRSALPSESGKVRARAPIRASRPSSDRRARRARSAGTSYRVPPTGSGSGPRRGRGTIRAMASQNENDPPAEETLTLPLENTPSESEVRLAQAQLLGWLEGLFQGIQAALWTQHMQARAEIDEMRRRRGLPPGPGDGPRKPGQYL